MQCPECRIDLVCEYNATAGVHLDVCRQCNGLWFDAGEISRAIKSIKGKPSYLAHKDFKGTPKKHARNRPCPCCSKYTFHHPMAQISYNSIELDFCETCRGFWLDSGELMMILQRFGKTKPPNANCVQSLPLELESVKRSLDPNQKSSAHSRKIPINTRANNSDGFNSEAVTEVAVEVGIEVIFEAIIGFLSS